jgi:uncharacterized membrane protein YeaQ/YmgE (transglycosylase-associated protein family)
MPQELTELVRAQVQSVLREFGLAWEAGRFQAVPQPASAAVISDVDENEAPGSVAEPVLAVGDTLTLALKKEGNRGLVTTIVLGLFGIVLTGTILASFRLPPDQNVEQLKDLSDTVLVIVVGTLAYYFGKKT